MDYDPKDSQLLVSQGVYYIVDYDDDDDDDEGSESNGNGAGGSAAGIGNAGTLQ